MAGNVTVWHRAGNEFRAAYRWWHKAALVFLPFLIKCVHSATKVMACERGRKVKGGKNGQREVGIKEFWKLCSTVPAGGADLVPGELRSPLTQGALPAKSQMLSDPGGWRL